MKQKERRLVHWSPRETFDRSASLAQEIGDGKIFCQAVVQVLFADCGTEWSPGEIGELVFYRAEPKRAVDVPDFFLSFFASERYRFLIKMFVQNSLLIEHSAFRSDGAKVWRAERNFVAILHGRLIGLNFSVEHQQQCELLVHYMQGFNQQHLSGRLLRALEHFQIARRRSRTRSPTAVKRVAARERTPPPKPKERKLLKGAASAEDPDPILQPREFLQKMFDCAASADI